MTTEQMLTSLALALETVTESLLMEVDWVEIEEDRVVAEVERAEMEDDIDVKDLDYTFGDTISRKMCTQ